MGNFNRGGPRRNFNRGGGGFRSFGPREMHKATCSACGEECEVPFKPSQDRPVYCRDCFMKQKGKKPKEESEEESESEEFEDKSESEDDSEEEY